MFFIINNEKWEVKLTSPFHPALLIEKGNFALGCCDSAENTIYINAHLNPALIERVLCHEIAHAVLSSYNIDINYNCEELIAEIVAVYGKQILITTNEIFKYIK